MRSPEWEKEWGRQVQEEEKARQIQEEIDKTKMVKPVEGGHMGRKIAELPSAEADYNFTRPEEDWRVSVRASLGEITETLNAILRELQKQGGHTHPELNTYGEVE